MTKLLPVDLARIAEALKRSGPIETKAMLRSSGLAIGGKVFALVVDDHLVLKLPRDVVTKMIEAGAGRPFLSGQRILREWVTVVERGSHEEQLQLAEQACRFVGSKA